MTMFLLFSLGNVEALYTIGVVLASVILYVITKVVRTGNQKCQDTQEQFNFIEFSLSSTKLLPLLL